MDLYRFQSDSSPFEVGLQTALNVKGEFYFCRDCQVVIRIDWNLEAEILVVKRATIKQASNNIPGTWEKCQTFRGILD